MDKFQKIRKKIDQIDAKIAALLKKRRLCVQTIREIKNSRTLKVKDEKRETEIMSKLETNFEKEIFKKILEESRKIQESSLT